MRKTTRLIIVVGLLISLWPFTGAQASHLDAFTFFVPYSADSLAQYFSSGGQQPGSFTVEGVEIVISISVLRDGVLIYYDHWEDVDGLESNPSFPVQPSTEVWGDADPSNGSPPDIPTDVLSRGDIITLRNVVPVPRDRANFFFDGGDRIHAVGGALAVTLATWPQPDGGILFAGAWELYPTSRWGSDYVIPIGQNVSRDGGGFDIVGLNIQAAHDGTTVQLDLNADGNPDGPPINLDEGGNFPVIDGVQSGAEIHASELVQVNLIAKNPLSTFQARAYTMLPSDQWADKYLAPRSSDGDFWLYNPHDTDLVVTAKNITNTRTITIPARSAGRYPPVPEPVLTARSGVYFSSTDERDFYGIAALDEIQGQDWGYALLPISNLTTQALISWAPGNRLEPPGPDPSVPASDGFESRVYVTALNDTTINVDYRNNGSSVPIDVPALQEVPIVDSSDFDMSGAWLFTDGEPFIAVWGQDGDAPGAQPSIDVGTNIVPLRAPSIQKSYDLLEEGYSCGTVSRGHTVRFTLLAFNDSALPISGAVVQDDLPPGINYLTGTTFVNGSNIGDDLSGSPFPLDEGGFTIDIEPMGTVSTGTVSITYDATIEDAGDFVNRVTLSDADPAAVELSLPFRAAGYEVTKTLTDPPGGEAEPGQVITFSVTITNTGVVSITELPLRDEFDPNYLTFRSADVVPDDDTVPGVVTWLDLISALTIGDLPPQGVINLSLSFDVADNLPTDINETLNIVLSEGVQGGDGIRQAIVCDEASVSFAPPPETPTPTPTPTSTSQPPTITPTPTPTATPKPPDDGGEPEPTPTPTPPPTPPQTPSVVSPPTPAVLLLPETGVGHYSKAKPVWPFLLLPGLGLLAGWVVYRRLNKPEK